MITEGYGAERTNGSEGVLFVMSMRHEARGMRYDPSSKLKSEWDVLGRYILSCRYHLIAIAIDLV